MQCVRGRVRAMYVEYNRSGRGGGHGGNATFYTFGHVANKNDDASGGSLNARP